VFGRTGVVVATEGDYTLTQLGDVTLSSPSNGQVLKYNGTTWVNGTDAGGLTSVGLSMPTAFNVANSPLTANGTIAVTGAGNATQYVRGDGALATLPTNGGGGGASVSYYLNGSINQGTLGGVTYYEMNKTPIIGAGTDFTRNSNGYIASFLTDANDPALLNIPAGNFNFETYFEASSGGGSPTFYIELYKYDGTTFTLIASNSTNPKLINDGTNVEAYFSALAVPQTTLTLTDRLAIRIYVTTAGRTITLHTENGNLSQVITTFTTGLTALNGLTAQVQYLATGTSGTDFNIASATATHTFNLPTASATNRGALSSGDWSVFNAKQNALTNPITGTGTSGQVAYFNGTSSLTSNAAFAFTPTSQLLVNNSVTAASAIARGTNLTPTLTAAANNDVLVGLDINPTFTNGAFTGTQNIPLRINATDTQAGGLGLINIVGSDSFAQVITMQPQGSSYTGFKTISFKAQTTSGQAMGIGCNFSTGNPQYLSLFGLSGQGLNLFHTTGNISINSTTDQSVKLFVNGTARISGNTSIGDGPSAILSVGTTNVTNVFTTTLKLNSNTGANTQGVLFQQNGVDYGYVFNNGQNVLLGSNAGGLLLQTNNTERVRIFTNGNFGINTGATDAGFRLDVNGTARVQGALTISNTSVGVITGGNDVNSRPIQFQNDATSGNFRGGYTFRSGFNGSAGVIMMRLFSGGANSANAVGIGNITEPRFAENSVRFAVQGRAAAGSEPTYEDASVFYADGTSYTYGNSRIFGILLGEANNSNIPLSTTSGNYGIQLGYQRHPLTTGWGSSMIMSAKDDGGSMNEVMRVMGRNQSVGIGVTQTTSRAIKFQLGGSVTATSALAQGAFFNTTLVAAANNDVLVGLDINPTFTNGAFTGVGNYGLRTSGWLNFNTGASLGLVFGSSITWSGGVPTNGLQIINGGIYYNGAGAGFFHTFRTNVNNSTGNRLVIGDATVQVLNTNLLVNTTTDAGFRLDVNGTARVQGDTSVSGSVTATGNSNSGITHSVGDAYNVRLNADRINFLGTGNSFSGLVIGSVSGFIGVNKNTFNSIPTGSILIGSNANGNVSFIDNQYNETFTVINSGSSNSFCRINGGYRYGTDLNASNFNIITPLGTGTGTGGDIVTLIGVAGTTGTTRNTTAEIMRIKSSTANISIGANATPNASAILDITSTTKGVLFPRMTTTQKNAISSPATGLQVYDTTLNQISYYNGTTWTNI
jgi:hypothetical protein